VINPPSLCECFKVSVVSSYLNFSMTTDSVSRKKREVNAIYSLILLKSIIVLLVDCCDDLTSISSIDMYSFSFHFR